MVAKPHGVWAAPAMDGDKYRREFERAMFGTCHRESNCCFRYAVHFLVFSTNEHTVYDG